MGAVRAILSRASGAVLVLLFILIHKVGDTLANLTFRLLFDDLKFTNDEIAFYDVWAWSGGFIWSASSWAVSSTRDWA